MPWQQAQQLRSAIGNIMGVPEVVQSVGKDQLKAAYGGISQDMKTSAAANGADTLFANANSVSTSGHAFIDNTLSKVIRSNNPSQETIRPEQAADGILRGGDTTLQAIRREMPKAADELASYKLRDMALATPGQAGATGRETSVGSFLTDLNKMRQSAPTGTQALFSDPRVSQRIDDLATVAAGMKETAKRANTSNTGPSMALAEMAPAAAAAYHATGGNLLQTAGAAIAPWMLNTTIGHAVTQPWINRLVTAPGTQNRLSPFYTGALSPLTDDRTRNRLIQP
jgi:hypothetical protein